MEGGSWAVVGRRRRVSGGGGVEEPLMSRPRLSQEALYCRGTDCVPIRRVPVSEGAGGDASADARDEGTEDGTDSDDKDK